MTMNEYAGSPQVASFAASTAISRVGTAVSIASLGLQCAWGGGLDLEPVLTTRELADYLGVPRAPTEFALRGTWADEARRSRWSD
jgi:hypothetical protein